MSDTNVLKRKKFRQSVDKISVADFSDSTWS